MNRGEMTFKTTVLAFVAATICLLCSAPAARAQISISIGVEPVCPYGYFDYAPYNWWLTRSSVGIPRNKAVVIW